MPNIMPSTNRKFDTGIPGFDVLSNIASQNVSDLLQGVESPAITQNINAQWGAASGLAPGSEFLRNRAVDLYGQRAEARRQRGLDDLLKMMQTYSGTAVATPGQILSSEDAAKQRQLQSMGLSISGLGAMNDLARTYLDFLK